MPVSRRASILLVLIVLFALPLAAQTATIRGRVTLPDGAALPGVTVSVGEVNAVSDGEGRYELSVPAQGLVKVSATLEGFQPRVATVDVTRGEATQDFTMNVSFGQEITVGSRAIGAEQEKAVPVDVISQEQIQSSPSTETNQIIQKMTPSFNFPRPTITDGTDSVRPATLRGLGPDQLLVMVNGKRRHASALVNANNSVGRGSSGVDLNAIPSAAIQNVEILRDGAAAQYGSDAIAGVINLVLKSDVAPLTLSAKTGMTSHGDGEMLDLSANGGWAVGRGVLALTGNYRVRYDTNRAGDDPRDQIVNGDANNNPVDQPTLHWGDSYARDSMLFANFNLPLTADGKQIFYAFGGYSNRHGSHGGNYRRSIQATNWPQIYPLGFLPLIQPRITDLSLTAGARGQLANWFYDVSTGYGENDFEFYVTDSLNVSLGPTVPPNQTRFYSGALGDDLWTANLDVSRPFTVGGLAGPLNVAFGLEFRRDGFTQEAGEPNSYINGGVRDRFGAVAAAGAQVFPGFQPSNEVEASRNAKSVYVDLEGDVLPKLRLGVAGRYENFSDFGDTTNGKITARYSALQQLILRASASTGFRAPSLSQGNFSAISTNFLANAQGVLEAFQVGTYRVDTPIARILGAEDLKAEKSKNFSAGLVWQPLSNLEFTADYFHIDIEDRIVFSGNFTGSKVLPLIQPLGATGARFFTNAIDTETNGYDLVGNYQRAALGGRLDLSAAYSRNETDVVGVVKTPLPLEGLGETLFDRIERRRVECGQPEDNVRLMQSFNRNAWNVTLRESRYGEYCSFTALVPVTKGTPPVTTLEPLDDQTFSAEWLADAEVSYRWNRYTLAVGAENLLDQFPDKNRVFRENSTTFTASSNFGQAVYPSQSPFGMNGRFFYTRVTFTF
jgi:iron complex outermembrane recepter protein